MAKFEAKAGSFSLFRNDKDGVDTRPDYKGDGADLDGNPIWVSAWLKEGKNGKFMSCNFKLKEDKPVSKPKPVEDEIPF